MEFFADAGWHVVEAKYGAPAAGGVRPAGRRAPARATSTTCRTRSTSRCSPSAAPSCASGSSPAPTPTWRPSVAGVRRRRPRPAGAEPRRPRPRGPRSTPTAPATRYATARASCSPTPSRAGACRSPAIRSTTPRCSRRPRSTSCRADGRARRPTTEWDRFAAGLARRAGCAPSVGGELNNRPGRRPGPCLPIPTRASARRHEQAGLDPGDVRPAADGRSATTPEVAATPGDDVARRQRLDQPRRLDQQDGRVQPRGAARLPRAPTGCCAGARSPPATTSSWASAR